MGIQSLSTPLIVTAIMKLRHSLTTKVDIGYSILAKIGRTLVEKESYKREKIISKINSKLRLLWQSI